ncbi:hypothetical protein C3F09_04080 [candidate division GN15 bacterium]|uniref:non-specific serine/threonine protein kinase n=1 Tax=candidate division GN15 bacterium TaxID=2072418 RepID=A0A855X448_9BACT|nr:MAG: hypothetical protein C3F09_04080 [candidate division GN15 bacterium]
MAPDDDKTQSHVLLTAGTMVSHYRIIEKIGAGGMGEVYLAEDTELNRKVALKFLPLHLCQESECRARFKREAQAAAQLDHPNIVSVFEVGEFQGRPFFSMQHVEGQSLKEVIAGKTLPLERILEIGIQVCDGLQAAHEKGVTHRDIKPSNILIDSHGRTRIVDFGLASVMGLDHLTKTGSTLGTIGYMSPEQVRGEAVDHRTDLFSFGVVLYEMITGHAPFKADSEAATLHAITDTAPQPLARFRREVPLGLQTIIDKALDKRVSTRYQHADELSADLKRLSAAASSVPSVRKRRIRIIVPILVVLGLVVIALILKPWQLEVSSTQESHAAPNWLAVMYFDNIADPADSKRLGEIATNLLITGLSQSEYIRVMSSQRLYDLLKQMGREGVKTIDRATASQIAQKAEATWMLSGSILQSEPTIVLTSQLIDVASGGVIASQRITGNEGDNIFAVIDRLTIAVKTCNVLPAAMRSEASIRIADVTTRSPEAYKYYLEGLEYSDKLYAVEARQSFRKAIELDSTFASAYFELSHIMGNIFGVSGQERLAAIANANRYAYQASDRERRRISLYTQRKASEETANDYREYLSRYSDDKSVWLDYAAASWKNFGGSADSALIYLKRAITLDPTYKQAYNWISYVYGFLGDKDKAFAAIDKYVELAPDEPNPYDTRGDLYAYFGQLDSALDSYRQALSIKPDFAMTIKKLGRMYLLAGQVARADSLYHHASTVLEGTERMNARSWLMDIASFQGKFDEALRLANDCISANRLDGAENENSFVYYKKGMIFDNLNMWDSAAANARVNEQLRVRLRAADTLGYEIPFLRWCYRSGDTAKASRLLERLAAASHSIDRGPTLRYWHAMGDIALARADFTSAVDHLNRAECNSLYLNDPISTHYRLAEAYLCSGDAQSAIAVLEKLLTNYSELSTLPDPCLGVTAHYLLGRAYYEIGERDKARTALEKFLTIWKDADAGLKDVEDAKARLARLKVKP